MSLPSAQPETPAWLLRFRTEPLAALDDLLRGLARIPPYERAAPPDLLELVFGGLPESDPDRGLLDATLRDWLAARLGALTPEGRAAYGLSRYVTESMNALSAVWLLRLPLAGAWIQDHFLDLTRWAAPLRLSEAWDLPRALAQAGALTQTDQRLRFHWLRLCKEAARPSQRDMIDPALSGLSRLPGTSGQGASPELIAGLARFGAELERTPLDQRDFLRRWRALKARFPRTAKTWHGLWQAALSDRQNQGKPFVGWLTDAEPVLRTTWRGLRTSPPTKGEVDALFQRLRRGERDTVLADIDRIVRGYEDYAEAAGDAYLLVRTACNLGKDVLPWAPGHALRWARDALRWEPSNGHAWDLRARALYGLCRADLAQAVYWEAIRRLPDDAVVRCQLALALLDQDRGPEAEALFREAHERDPSSAIARVELARLLARTDRQPEAEDLLRRTLADLPDNPIAVYTLALLLIAWGRARDAARIRDRYVARFGQDQRSATLGRLLVAGADGTAEVQHHLSDRDLHAEPSDQPIAADGPVAEDQAAREARSAGPLHSAAGASRADLLFRMQEPAAAEQALAGLLEADADDIYAQVVWALHIPERRPRLAAAYRDALGALAPHLAAAGLDTPAGHWEVLAEAFPERQGLIDLTRLVRTGSGQAANGRIADWMAGGDAQDAFVRARLKSLVERDRRLDPAAPELEPLLADAIRREVDLGDGVLGEAA